METGGLEEKREEGRETNRTREGGAESWRASWTDSGPGSWLGPDWSLVPRLAWLQGLRSAVKPLLGELKPSWWLQVLGSPPYL